MALEPRTAGPLADHPAAGPFAREVLRVHRRYAVEVVGGFALCPFVKQARGDAADGAFGQFWVMLDRGPDLDLALRAVRATPGSVAHLVYPLLDIAASDFERFGAALGKELRRAHPSAPVMAIFHPELSGDTTDAHRLVGVLRHAPDPFIQLVPEGLQEGGTVFAGAGALVEDRAEQTFARLAQGELPRLLALLDDIRADRDRNYPPHLAALASFAS